MARISKRAKPVFLVSLVIFVLLEIWAKDVDARIILKNNSYVLEKDKNSNNNAVPAQKASVVKRSVNLSTNSGIKYYKIEQSIAYRFWNMAHGFWLQRGPDNVIICGSSAGDPRVEEGYYNTTVLTSLWTPSTMNKEDYFVFFFKEGNWTSAKKYALKAESETHLVASEFGSMQGADESMMFEDMYYWGFKMFRSVQYPALYLGCTGKGKAILVNIQDSHVPDPRALFIVYKQI